MTNVAAAVMVAEAVAMSVAPAAASPHQAEGL